MPLIQGKSPKAFESNVKAEMEAGKPQKQSLAIAYAIKKAAMKRASGKAMGGMVEKNPASSFEAQKANMEHEDLEKAEMFAVESPVHHYPHMGMKHEDEHEFEVDPMDEKSKRRAILSKLFG